MPELTSTVLDYRVDRILEMGFTPGQAGAPRRGARRQAATSSTCTPCGAR
jgi:hypothetical protein